MKILLLEWMTAIELSRLEGPGQVREESDWPHSLASFINQGAGMLLALAADLQNSGFEPVLALAEPALAIIKKKTERDFSAYRLDAYFVIGNQANWQEALRSPLQSVDAVWCIAPESDGCLASFLDYFDASGVPCFHTRGELAALATSKTRTIEYLADRGVQPLFGGWWNDQHGPAISDRRQPMVLKPDDGAGSEGIRIVEAGDSLPHRPQGLWRWEPKLRGTPISVSVIRGPRQTLILEPTKQLFNAQPVGDYIGGQFPIDAKWQLRAPLLVQQAIECLPPWNGYIGFDLLVDIPDVPQGCLILEINPRLTCSYLGLRTLYQTNLAAATIRLIQSQPVTLDKKKVSGTFFIARNT